MMSNKKISINDTLYENQYFFFPLYIFLFLGALMVFQNAKGDMLIWVNQHHSDTLDAINKFLSDFIGKGYVFAVALLILGAVRLRYLVFGLSSFLLTGIVVQILKRIFDMPRPKGFYESLDNFHLVDGVDVYSNLSFPSGHSATAFAMFLFLSLITRQKWLGLVYFLLAYFTAFSRLYLMQHFLIDIYFGMIIGILITFGIWYLLETNKKINDSKWIDYSLLNEKILSKNK